MRSIFHPGGGSSVGIVTQHGLEVLNIETMGARFFEPIRACVEAKPATCKMGNGFLLRVKQPGLEAEHQPRSSAGDE